MHLKDETDVHNPNISKAVACPKWEEYNGKEKCDLCGKQAKYKRKFKFKTKVELVECDSCHNPKKKKPELGMK